MGATDLRPDGGGPGTSAGPGAAVSIERLDVRRGGTPVLRDLSLTVRSGAVTGLVGPSGSGKTTLMRCIVGTQIVASGDVKVLGAPAGSAELRERVSYVTQSPSVYADLTAVENLRYFARILRAPMGDIARVLDEVRLRADARRPVRSLSGGQQARVSLAVALLGRPELLVLDEPTVGLDPVLRRDLWALFGRLAGEERTLLVSSHVMDEAERCEELLLMRDGRLLASGTPAALRRRTGASTIEDAFLRLVEEA